MERKIEKNAEIAIIGGTGIESLLECAELVRVGTPYGFPPLIAVGEIQKRVVAFLPRHGREHSVPPHKVNYRANIYALYKMGVERIIATNAVGAINPDFKPGDLVIPHDLIDFTKQRPLTFYDEAPATHVDFSEPYCSEIRRTLQEKAKENASAVWDRAVYVCTEGPRFETPAEIRMFRALGCDVVGMTGAPEAILARELGMCYATLCFVSNMAAGVLNRKITVQEVIETSKIVSPKIHKVLIDTILNLPKTRHCSCSSLVGDSKEEKDKKC